MGSVSKSNINNISSPNGNSLAVFVDGEDDELKLKDIYGNVQNLNDYIPQNSSSTAFFYANSRTTQTFEVATDTPIDFENVSFNSNINLFDDNQIEFKENGLYDLNVSLQTRNEDVIENSLCVFVLNKTTESNLQDSAKYYQIPSNVSLSVLNYNLTIEITESTFISIMVYSSSNLVNLKEVEATEILPSSPSATISINKIANLT